jgi:hypothetical protein
MNTRIYLIVFLLFKSGLTFSQSKKEQIEILKNRVDSLNMIINNERSFNIQSVIEKDAKITSLESKISTYKEANNSLQLNLQIKELDINNKNNELNFKKQEIEKLMIQVKIKADSLTYYKINESLMLNDSLYEIKYFLKSDEFRKIKQSISNEDYNNLENVWTEYIDDTNAFREYHSNYLIWGLEDIGYKMFLHNDYIIFTYHLTAGSNTGTLIYDRKKNTFKTHYFFTNELSKNDLSITREGYDNGHWWQAGVFHLSSGLIEWDKNIDK